MRILIVEDEPDLLDALKKQLQSSGYSVDGCGNGLDAEDYLKMATYDAVVLDIMLPGIDGLTLLKKNARRRQHYPCFAFNGSRQH